MNKPEQKVAVCVNCLYRSTHPFGLQFDRDGVCSGCLTHREKMDWDWSPRFHILEDRVREIIRSTGFAHYDCVVPVRGTPEYFYVLDVVKNRLGLNPLVVSYNSQFNSLVGIKNLDRLREAFDVDILVYTTNPWIYKKLIRESLVRLNSMRWPFLAGETSFPVQVAAERGISLVVWPYHQPTEQVGMHSYRETPEMSRRGRAEFDLMGVEPEALLAAETTIVPSDVVDIEYPGNRALHRHGITGIYLANYLPWDSRRYSEAMIQKFGALAASNPRTFDTYDRVDDMTYMTVHDILKYAKLGYSRVTDNLCREIRFGRITRADAVLLEQHYQAHYPREGIRVFLQWLGMSESGLDWYLERLPFSVPKTDHVPVLTDSLRSYMSAYLRNHEDVVRQERYIVYGKGVELDSSEPVEWVKAFSGECNDH